MSPAWILPWMVSWNLFVIALVDEAEDEVTVVEIVDAEEEELVTRAVGAGVEAPLPQAVAHPTARADRTKRKRLPGTQVTGVPKASRAERYGRGGVRGSQSRSNRWLPGWERSVRTKQQPSFAGATVSHWSMAVTAELASRR